MTKSRRKLFARIAEAAAVGLVVLNLALYFALVRPLKSLRATAEQDSMATRGRAKDGKARVAVLEQIRVNLPESEEQLWEFLKKHVPERRQGFSHAARMMRKLSASAKVRLTGVSYKLFAGADDPLARLALEIEVGGVVPDLLQFTHALETSPDFLAVRAFSFTPGETHTVAMHVSADLYVRPRR